MGGENNGKPPFVPWMIWGIPNFPSETFRNRSRLLDALGLGLADGISFGATVNACDRASQWEVAIELVTEMQRRRMQQNLGIMFKIGGKVVDRTVTKGECSSF